MTAVPHSPLKTLQIDPAEPAETTLIWLHGLGADGEDFVSLASALDLDANHTRLVLPHAPVRPITINNHLPMRAWYDIKTTNPGAEEDEAGLLLTEQAIQALIEAEIKQGIPAKNILLAGFSQGGASALFIGLRYPQALKGIIALSAYLPSALQTIATRHQANLHTPVFMAHGQHDTLVLHQWGHATATQLQTLQHPVTWHDYPIEHTVCPEEIMDLKRWLHLLS